MVDRPDNKPDQERENPPNPMDHPEREPFREPKRPFDPDVERGEKIDRQQRGR